jgi:dTDP-4-dehydrorhamnose 3,5-epimerase
MRFLPTPIPGAWIVEPEPRADPRGFFARTFCVEEFRKHNLNPRVVQCNLSHNLSRGTLRGMHWQCAPRVEAKLVACFRGAIFDAIVDLRPDSPAHLKSFTVELSEENRRMLYVPEGVAHGFLTLADQTDVHYQMSEYFAPECARGARWDDPAFGIAWPEGEKIIHDKDLAHPAYREEPT